jgi:hypothetical protein
MQLHLAPLQHSKQPTPQTAIRTATAGVSLPWDVLAPTCAHTKQISKRQRRRRLLLLMTYMHSCRQYLVHSKAAWAGRRQQARSLSSSSSSS